MAAYRSRSRAFMLELIMDIVVFTLCAIISSQVFIEARMISNHSSALSHLSVEVQVVAETVKAFDGDADAILASLDAPGVVLQQEGRQSVSRFIVYYDQSFIRSSDESLRYSLVCVIDSSQPITVATIDVYDGQKELYHLVVKDYVPSRATRGGGV